MCIITGPFRGNARLEVGHETCDKLRTNSDTAGTDSSATDLVVGIIGPAREAGYDALDAVTIGMASATRLYSNLLGE